MLKISRLTDYGILVLVAMAENPEEIHNPARLSKQLSIPAPTVSKLLKKMTAGGLLQSRRGKSGGYRLSTDPAHITLATVLNVLEGPVAVTECSAASGLCQLENNCTVRGHWQQINSAIYRGLNQLSLASMTQPPAGEVLPLHMKDSAAAEPQCI